MLELVSQLDFILQYDWIKYTMVGMVILRMLFKPIFAILGKYVELTVEEDDNKKLHKIMKSKGYKLAVFIIDMLTSIRLPKLK